MMQEKGDAVDSRLREDNNFILHFFTTTASVLSNHNLISDREADNLRITVNSIQGSAEFRTNPAISQFIRLKSEFLAILIARFGQQGLAQNILRLSAYHAFSKIRLQMAVVGNELLDKVKLFFNKDLSLYSEGVVDRHVIYSTLALDSAEALSKCIALLDTALQEFSLMVPHSMANHGKGESDLDEKIAQALGFSGLQPSTLTAVAEQNARLLAARAVECVANVFVDVTQKITSAKEMEQATRVQLLASNLRIEGQRLGDFQQTLSNSLLDWEARRQTILNQSFVIGRILAALGKEFVDLLAQVGSAEKVSMMSKAVTRQIQFGLMKKGIDAHHAIHAAEEVSAYLRQHAINPNELLPGELRTVNGKLGAEAFEVLNADQSSATAREQINAEKSRSLQRSRTLSVFFANAANTVTTIVILLLAVTIASCGLKLAPRNEKLDFRPEIPFHGSGFYNNDGDSRKQSAAEIRPELPADMELETKGSQQNEK